MKATFFLTYGIKKTFYHPSSSPISKTLVLMTLSPLQWCGFQYNNIFYNNLNGNLEVGTWSNEWCGFQYNNIFYKNVNGSLEIGTWSTDSKVNVLHNKIH